MSPGILHVELPESCEQIVLLVDRDYLLSRVAEEYRSRFLELISRRSVQAATTSIDSLQARACRLLNQCIKLDEITGAAVQQAEAMVLGLIDAVSMKDIAATPPLSQRRKGFERAMDILMQANLSGLDVPRLARAAAVSQRTLEYAFQDSLGMTPLEFFCRKRLHAARRELLESECNETTITEIALRNGFTHPSRFAQHYSRVFGEKPSDTLRQRRNTAGF
jgi:transcriptional regulator GlxA family with amidase domain